MKVEFKAWPATPRYFRDIVITEKIDGTNAAIHITEDAVIGQRRTGLLGPGEEHYGLSAWLSEHQNSLREDLGTGTHFGEWYGWRINRGYDLKERRFALFNTKKWSNKTFVTPNLECVPVLYEGSNSTSVVKSVVDSLRLGGSIAVPGYKRPEGIVIFHTASNQVYKVTLENDDKPKSLV